MVNYLVSRVAVHSSLLTSIVFIPVRSVTVADPPRISIDDTMIFVARLSNGIRHLSGKVPVIHTQRKEKLNVLEFPTVLQ